MVRALALCASAYERVGLLWAARGTLLNAASIASNEWWAHSEVTLAQHGCYNRLKWVELQLGRVPQLLAWHELDRATRLLLKAEGYSDERLSRGEREFDAIVGILLLRSDLWELKQLEHLPDSLHGLDLNVAGVSLVFALGHTGEDAIGHGMTEEDQSKTMRHLAAQPAGRDLPPAPSLMSERTLTFRSVVLGCAIELTTDNRSPSIELSESILAAIESLLATSVLEGVSPRVGVLRIRVKHSDFAQFPFASEWVEVDGLPAVNVRCAAFRVSGLDPEQQGGIKRSVAELVSHVLGRAFMVDGESTLERLFRDEQALVRALDFTGSFGAIANTLGSAPRFQIQDWAVDSQTRFNLRRSSEWDADRRAQALKDSKERVRPSILPGSGESITDELPDVSRVKHSEITFESLIRESLWNRARWRAIGWSVGGGMPPWMVLGFENGEAAAEILTQLVRDIGAKDLENRLRITIVKGISKRNPTHYRVVIGSNVDAGDVKKFGAVMFRVHTMTPNSTQNLDRFLAAYEKLGAYLVGIGEVNPRAPKMPEPMRHGYVLKKTLQVRDAWTIGVNDIDGAGVMPDDDVPIPQDRQNDAPVLELLKWKEEQSHRAQWPSLAKKTHSKARGQRKADGKAKRLKKNERRRGR